MDGDSGGGFGTEGNDTLNGSNGKDNLFGAGGDDLLQGNNGNDVLNGGAGNDTLEGGNGSDTFVIGEGTDTISDFGNNDVIGLSGGISYEDLTFSGNDIIFSGETIATLSGVDTTGLSESDFTSV